MTIPPLVRFVDGLLSLPNVLFMQQYRAAKTQCNLGLPSWPEIFFRANCYIRRATLYRRLSEGGVSHLSSYSDIPDADLDAVVVQIKTNHPNDGERMKTGHLTGIIVPRARLRA